MKAIILSAGQGKRLLPLTESRPKCLIPLAGITLLEWQIRGLAANGVSEAVVVVGFAAEEVEKAVRAMQVPGIKVRTLLNPFYTVADNLGSCFIARHEMQGDFMIVNGDTLFEPAVLERVLREATAPITVTIDRKDRYDADDMKVQTKDGRLLAIGKTLPLDIVDGESIGMLKFTPEGGATFRAEVENALRSLEGLKRWYLSVIHTIAQGSEVGTVSIQGLEWGEVDFPADVSRAEQLAQGWQARGVTAAAG
ncbi:MAG TPA: phosphocholine cytidylyltransferase family protein [Azospirillaceae bacterium]|nr:phosphocholine cytidylyltransferase family protein [Azospirillaceae bacterium]